MAFQPIVDIDTGTIFAYEALVRPIGGGVAAAILDQIDHDNRYAFDQACRVQAITLAARLEMTAFLAINFLANAVYHPAACLEKTLDTAARWKFPLAKLMFEVSENEPARDAAHLQAIFKEYKRHGMFNAIDDFGAGHSGLNMLADFQPNVLKIDMALTRAIHNDPIRFEIAKAIIGLCRQLSITVIAEGIETVAEAVALKGLGVRLFQGFLFARPAIEELPRVSGELIDTIRRKHDDMILSGLTCLPERTTPAQSRRMKSK